MLHKHFFSLIGQASNFSFKKHDSKLDVLQTNEPS